MADWGGEGGGMKRNKKELILGPGEDREFIRALRLFGRIRETSSRRIEELVRHEEAHIAKSNELNCQGQVHYFITAKRRDFSAGLRLMSIGERERILISLAPEDPSPQDMFCALTASGQYDKLFKEMGSYYDTGGTGVKDVTIDVRVLLELDSPAVVTLRAIDVLSGDVS